MALAGKNMSEFESQILWVTVKSESDKTYYITSEKMRDMYYLWTESKVNRS